MSIKVGSTLDFANVTRMINVPDAVNPQEPTTLAQMNSAIEGLAWKDSVRVSTQGNINLAAPGATIDAVSMVSGDRFVARAQSAAAENGVYNWNGAATPATRSLDCSTAAELEQAVVTVEEGTNAGVTYRQTSINFTLGSGAVTWTNFGTAAPSASETSQGIAEIATQAETDAGTDDSRIVTPLKLATSPFAVKKFNQNIGDGSATSFTVTHNLNTRDVQVSVYENAGSFREVIVEIQHTSVNAVTIVFDTGNAPAANAYRVLVRA